MLNNPRLNRYDNILDVLPTGKASGAIAAFDCGADGLPIKALTVQIAPIQDLHGYANPWPAGGGKNRLRLNISGTIESNGITATVNPDGSVTLNGTTTAGNTFFNLNYVSGSTLSIEKNVPLIINGSSEPVYVAVYAPDVIASSKNGADVAFTIPDSATVSWCRVGIPESGVTVNNLTVYPMIRSASETDPTFAPYSNICPISGRTGTTVSRLGNNLCNMMLGMIRSNDGAVLTDNKTYLYSDNYICIRGNRRVTVSGMPATTTGTGSHIWAFYDERKNYLGYIPGASLGSASMTSPSNVPDGSAYLRFRVYYGDESAAASSVGNIMTNYGTTADPLEAYKGEEFTISWQTEAGTVYGGTLDVTTGLLTVTMAEVDLGTLSWSYSSGAFISEVLTHPAPQSVVGGSNNVICSNYKAKATRSYSDNYGNLECGVSVSGTQLIVKDTSYSDTQTFKTAMSGVPLVYELATPLTYTLTTAELTSLLRDNNVWADCGDVEAEIRLDIGLALDKLTNAVLSLGSNT